MVNKTKVLLPCGACTHPLEFEVRGPQLSNLPEVSMLIVTHDEFVECPKCKQTVGIMLAGLSAQGLVFRTIPVQRPEEKKMLIPPNGFGA